MTFLSDSLLPATTALGIPLLLMGSPETGRPVLVVAPPGTDSARLLDIVGRADGRVLRGAGPGWMAVAVSEHADFPRRLRDAGAWIVVSASTVAGCPATDTP
jgi:hypothetical protein